MTQKKKKNGHRTHKKGVSFEDEITELLTKNRYMIRAQLVKYILEVHKGELGYSEKTINRKLDEMIKKEDVHSLKYHKKNNNDENNDADNDGNDDLSKYGIKETDRRVSYLILKKTMKIKKGLDKIFYYIVLGEPSVQKLALEKIRSHSGEYLLDPYQLDVFVSCLHSKNDNLVDDLLDTLCEYILGRGIEPSNKDKLLESLRDLLKRYTGSLEHTNIRRHVFWLLGIYKDYDTVIDQLKKDAVDLEDPMSIVSEYCNEYVAPSIKESTLELFAFKLELKGNEKASEFISRIEESASTIENKLKRLENNAQLVERIKKLREEKTK
jgi:hypothetical protein